MLSISKQTKGIADFSAGRVIPNYLPELTRLSIVWYPLRGSVLLLKTSTDPTDGIIGGIGPSPERINMKVKDVRYIDVWKLFHAVRCTFVLHH
jgi:hypothetical protein